MHNIFESIFNRILKGRNLKISNFPSGKTTIFEKGRFRKRDETSSILASFSEAKTAKNLEKNVLKSVCFFNIDFLAFFCDFFRFWLDFGGGRNRQKIEEKLKKSIFQRVHFLRMVLDGSRRVLGLFSGDSERIFNGFCDDFLRNLERETMIRATMGISMDGCMDGWMDGWMDGSINGSANRSTDVSIHDR